MKIKFKHELKIDDNYSAEKIVDIILKNRQIRNKGEFLNPLSPLKIDVTDFGFKSQITKTLKILTKIRRENKMIVVYTDYDADGITGGAILWETLHLLGFKVMPYVPHRKHEGYGFSKIGIDNVKKLYDPSLIISVDHGITAYDKIAYAKSLNISVIVTDHHLKPDKLPTCAQAIFHIPSLSGAGVSYFFSKMIFNYFKKSLTLNVERLTNFFQTDYLALSTIGTIADLVPLIGPSRSLTKYGLKTFSNIKRVGIKHILKEAGIFGKNITPYEVGFMIAPRINAVGRLEHAIDALRLLCTTQDEKAKSLASRIGDKNRERQDLVEKAVASACKKIGKIDNKQKVIILRSETWHEGIIGLIASKIAEKYYRPTIVLTKTNSVYKGSARSIAVFHITNFLRDLKEFLIDVGGHKQAAGFTIEEKNLKKFISAAEKKANQLLSKKDLERLIEADLKIPLSKINLKLAQSLESLEPFGIGNPKPTFYSEVEILDAKIIGKKSNHLKLVVKDQNKQSFPMEMLAFSSADKFNQLSRGQKIEVVYSIEVDKWGGNEKLSGKIIYFL